MSEPTWRTMSDSEQDTKIHEIQGQHSTHIAANAASQPIAR